MFNPMRSPIIFSNDATPAARRSYGSTSHPHVTPLFEGAFEPDMLGEGYERCTIDLGVDPDGETDIVATVVRHLHQGGNDSDTSASSDLQPSPRSAVLYVHGMTDYFFQTHVAEFFGNHGYDFYAVDLRKCGRSWRAGQRWHHITDLSFYDVELDAVADYLLAHDGGAYDRVIVMAHSTGGLIAPLWLHRRAQRQGLDGIEGMILNSPWLDMMVPKPIARALDPAIGLIAKLRPDMPMPPDNLTAYGESIHKDFNGVWDFDRRFKPVKSPEKSMSWLSAIFVGHRAIRAGLGEVNIPTLVLHSSASHINKPYSEATNHADSVLDVRDIARWAPALAGSEGNVTTRVIEGARHDVFLSEPTPRAQAFSDTAEWLTQLPATTP